MLIHDRFVFLHVPKTGGRFVRHALSEEVQGCRSLRADPRDTHQGWRAIPADAARRPVLAFVRNPWDWYVSWYSYASDWLANKPAGGRSLRPIHRRLLLAPRRSTEAADGAIETVGINDFATTVRLACELKGGDFYTSRLFRILGEGLGSDLLTMGRFESLADDLESFLERAGVEPAKGAMARIRAASPRGASRRGDYHEYYDDELRELVAAACRGTIESYGYEF